ncbi:MAG: sigma-54-dependent Fis family transcriptional regulator [Candidatus Wallbacteria bacterium]|nr:sigma-54-dependent Fis family transcriptional regulator [Candidatus Wallbacteria bacterium]
MRLQRVLVVDDEAGLLEVCQDILSRLPDVEVLLERDPRRAAARLGSEVLDLLVTDIRMPEMSGVDLLRLAREADPGMLVLMLTGFPAIETAVETMKLGAFDYIVKPFIPDDLLATASRALEQRRLRDENRLLVRHVARTYRFGNLVGGSVAMRFMFDLIERTAATDTDVLVVGESGTGKELVARSLHANSKRRDKRFVPVDCGAIPDDLLENEFFGHDRGAFSGANEATIGLLEFAEGGTLFLDEVGELPLLLQAKLLRAIQERRFRRLGGRHEIQVDVRIIAATNREIEEEVRAKRFREDLYYRINVLRIDMPPLRAHAEDVPLLVESMIPAMARELGREPVSVGAEALEVLCSYSWPGNVRELQNMLKRAATLDRDGVIGLDDLPEQIIDRAGEGVPSAKGGFFRARQQRLEDFEQSYLRRLLQTCQGDVAVAAREAMLPRGTFYRLMKKYGIQPDEFRS